MPTETVYGLAGNALDPGALAAIFKAKERPTFDPLIVHIGETTLQGLLDAGIVDGARIPTGLRDALDRMASAFWPGPLTLVLPKTPRVPDLATSGLPTVAVRSPRHPVAQALLREAGVPLAAPSANRFGRISPTTAQAVREELGGRIPWILDGGPCEVGLESTIVGMSADGSGELELLRAGGVPIEKIEAVLGYRLKRRTSVAVAGTAAVAPGMLESHYAPAKRLEILPAAVRDLPESFRIAAAEVVGLLAFSGDEGELSKKFSALREGPVRVRVRVLSRTGDLDAAAQALFAAMRELDASDAEVIYAEPCPSSEGLGFAIADRLRRAAAPRG